MNERLVLHGVEPDAPHREPTLEEATIAVRHGVQVIADLAKKRGVECPDTDRFAGSTFITI